MAPIHFIVIIHLFLASAVLALLGPGRMAVGYRHAHPAQVESYRKAGDVLTWERSETSEESFSTFGIGVYMSPKRNGWVWKKQIGNYHCLITADEAAFTQNSKVKIPTYVVTKSGLRRPIEGILGWVADYIKEQCADPDTAIRLPLNSKGKIEIMIPPSDLNQAGADLDLRVICEQNVDDLPDIEINLNSPAWTANAVGNYDSEPSVEDLVWNWSDDDE
ncbi:hypothetical protein N7510_008667 [Penicillium lagena]|uniref:uncharacterized protein n=1 Tax=Penicillium lagena TaxID=94218 RepID=UPI0025407F28|nr:uncharacterized protein N7510_008667 [Penicillium lagena]KAJ5605886.1 hypothetical protein N7510_008667 [Penicillium lagena]